MKFIHLTDTHIVGNSRLLYGINPAQRLREAITSIKTENADADFVVITGDLTHWGDDAAYKALAKELERLAVSVILVVGNHDDTPAFRTFFPDAMRDEHGFVQGSLQTDFAKCLFLDTTIPRTDQGMYCEKRQAWLKDELERYNGPILLFMHHPPFSVGIPGMDEIMLEDSNAFYDAIKSHAGRIRHLFFGHVHRPIFGNWRGISFSCMRGTNHQVACDTLNSTKNILGNLEEPAYGIVLLEEDQVTIHMHEYRKRSPEFRLDAPEGGDARSYMFGMRHEGGID
ncbi:MAG: phosphodiesterase [Sneathiellales bacterium]|nr:phosphodiesterase [Sneathiellales bacterium]